MNILVINQEWFAPSWRAMGHSVITCGYSGSRDVLLPRYFLSLQEIYQLLPHNFTPDLIAILDDGTPISFADIHSAPVPVIFYSVDTHHLGFLHFGFSDLFDHVYVAQKDYMGGFRASHSSWLPLWCSKPSSPHPEKKFEAIFVGTMDRGLNPHRVQLLEQVQRMAPLDILQGPFERFFPFAKIILNQSVKGDLNFRVFEAMCSGALLITDRVKNGLLELFNDHEHLVTYEWNNPTDAAHQICSLLKQDSNLRKIAETGRQKVLEEHLEMHRAKCILETLPIQKSAPNQASEIQLLRNFLIWSLTFDHLNRASALEGYGRAFQQLTKISPANLSQEILVLAALACGSFDLRTGASTGSRIHKELENYASAELPSPQREDIRDLTLWKNFVGSTLSEIRSDAHAPYKFCPSKISDTDSEHPNCN